MPTDTLVLGPFVFTDFAVPDELPVAAKQRMVIHRLPGGARVIDAMGPDSPDRAWRGILWGAGAESDLLTLKALCNAGQPLPYSNGFEAMTVIISRVEGSVHKVNCIHYDICVTPIDDDGGDGGFGGLFGLGASILSDLTGALGGLS